MSKEFSSLNIGNESYSVKDIKARPFKTIEELKSISNLSDGDIVRTIGYYEVNDLGGATYLIRTRLESDVEDNGGIHFLNTDLLAELIEEEVNIKQFGAKGDGVSDDTQSFINYANYCKSHNKPFIVPYSEQYYVVSSVTLTGIYLINILGKIKPSGIFSIKCTFGSNNVPSIFINEIYGELDLYGLNTAKVTIRKCRYLKLTAENTSEYKSLAYTQFYLGYINKLHISSPYSNCWINENLFVGGRFEEVLFDGEYSSSDNLFTKPMFESATITINKGNRNIFESARLEGTCNISFGVGTYGNVVKKTFMGSNLARINNIVEHIDNGDNICYLETGLLKKTGVSINEFNNPNNLTITNHKLTSSNNVAILFESGLIKLPEHKLFFELINPSLACKFYLYIYDEDENLIHENNQSLEGYSYSFNATNGYYATPNPSENMVGIFDSSKGTKYVKFMIRGNGSPFECENVGINILYEPTQDVSMILSGLSKNITQ